MQLGVSVPVRAIDLIFRKASKVDLLITTYEGAHSLRISHPETSEVLTAIVSIPLWLKNSQKTSKKFAFILGLVVFCISLLIIYSYQDISPTMLIALLVFTGFDMSTYFPFPWAMMPDTVEYSEWKTGIRQEGFLYGIFVFGLKLSQALAGFVAGLFQLHAQCSSIRKCTKRNSRFNDTHSLWFFDP